MTSHGQWVSLACFSDGDAGGFLVDDRGFGGERGSAPAPGPGKDGTTANPSTSAAPKNTLTVTGRCDSVIIGGDDNKIIFEKVDTELIVAGLNNTVTYLVAD